MSGKIKENSKLVRQKRTKREEHQQHFESRIFNIYEGF